MPLSEPQFQQRLTRESLPSLILLASAEPLLLLEAADAVRQKAREQGYAERVVLEAGNDFDWDSLDTELANRSLFSTRRLIELRLPTGKPGKDGAKTLIELSKNPAPDTVLLIQCAQWSRAHETAWVKAVDGAGWFVPMWPIKLPDLPRWISQRLKSRGLQAEPQAIAILTERSEGNLLAAAQEVDKLALLFPDGRLDAAHLQALVADNARYDVFGLVDAALAGETAHALRMVSGLQAEGVQIPALLPWLTSQLQLLIKLATVQAQRGNLAQAMRSAGLWQNKEALFKRALQRGNVSSYENLLGLAARIDRLSKGREDGDAWRELERLIAGLATPAAWSHTAQSL